MPDLTLTVGGMTCSGCARHVTEALEVLPGVASASVPGWESGRADVTLADDAPVSTTDLVAAVEAAPRGWATMSLLAAAQAGGQPAPGVRKGGKRKKGKKGGGAGPQQRKDGRCMKNQEGA